MFLALSVVAVWGMASCVSTLDGVHARAVFHALMVKRRLVLGLVYAL